MDHFGIGAAISATMRIYFQSSRRTGRTTSLLESLKDGDRVIFCEPREAQRFERLCKERGIKVTCLVLPPQDPHRIQELGTSAGDGRTLFDHTWVERHYLAAIEQTAREIDVWQKHLSGFGEAHRATRRAAEEFSRWGF